MSVQNDRYNSEKTYIVLVHALNNDETSVQGFTRTLSIRSCNVFKNTLEVFHIVVFEEDHVASGKRYASQDIIPHTVIANDQVASL